MPSGVHLSESDGVSHLVLQRAEKEIGLQSVNVDGVHATAFDMHGTDIWVRPGKRTDGQNDVMRRFTRK